MHDEGCFQSASVRLNGLIGSVCFCTRFQYPCHLKDSWRHLGFPMLSYFFHNAKDLVSMRRLHFAVSMVAVDLSPRHGWRKSAANSLQISPRWAIACQTKCRHYRCYDSDLYFISSLMLTAKDLSLVMKLFMWLGWRMWRLPLKILDHKSYHFH